MNGTVTQILKDEFHAEDGSFLIQLRSRAKWDQKAFSRLTNAMFHYAKSMEGNETDLLERWVGWGYWYLCVEVPALARNLGLLNGVDQDYYRAKCQLLEELAYWLFSGQSPYEPNLEFDDLESIY